MALRSSWAGTRLRIGCGSRRRHSSSSWQRTIRLRDLPPGDALAYRIRATMLRSQGAYQQRYHAHEMSAKARETLDKLPWEEALQKGGAAFVYRRVRFLTEEGILRWVAANGNHIQVNAAPSGDCRKCTSLRVEEGKHRHRHFQCPHWS